MKLSKTSFNKILERIRKKAMDPKVQLEHENMIKETKRNEELEKKIRAKTILYKSGVAVESIDDDLSALGTLYNNQKNVVSILNNFNPKKDYRLPYIFGRPGSGKTFIAKRFVPTAIKKYGSGIKFVVTSNFIIQLREIHSHKFSEITNIPFLVLDDFGSHNITKFSSEILHAIIDTRLQKKRPTLITSNIKINEIAKIFYKAGKVSGVSEVMCDAIEDRVFELCTIAKLDGESIRLKKAIKRASK